MLFGGVGKVVIFLPTIFFLILVLNAGAKYKIVNNYELDKYKIKDELIKIHNKYYKNFFT